MRVLCVAEKPSIARSISQILSGGQFESRPTRNKYIKNFDFDYPHLNAHFTVTSVSGHLMEHDFDQTHRAWSSCDPMALFDAPVEAKVASDSKTIEDNLRNESRRANQLMIWTDCDREGENIGAEVAKICRSANNRIQVRRARFSAIIPQQIHRAAQHPVELDQAQADAVEARTILDLRLGAAFTRMQTMTLQGRMPQLKDIGGPISYGPCQFPTLGFVVSRYEQIQEFVPETFWYIYLSLSRTGVKEKKTKKKDSSDTEFSWARNRLFDFDVAVAIYQGVLDSPEAIVTKVTNKPTKKWKPLPLTTVELQKAGSRLLKMAPKKVLDIAEKLYQQGFLSYPRTETDQFDPQFDFMTLIDKQRADPTWGTFATQLHEGGFSTPRKGKKDDKAHPPIHPTAHVSTLVGQEKAVYEFVTRRFLACCSKDAEGWETNVEVTCGGEYFNATGLVISAKNYLEVYVYDKWSDKDLPEFEEGERFMPSVCELREGQTTKPQYLTEADLVTLMDKNGIGTDATIAQHIQTIVDRGYVIERMEGATKHLVPSTLGIGLVEGYNEIGFDRSLSKPQLRRETERRMVEVCERTKTKSDMLEQTIDQYKEVFVKARREFDKVIASVRRRLDGQGGLDVPTNGDEGDGGRRGGGNGGRGRGGPARRGGGGGGSGGGRASRRGDGGSDTDMGGPDPPRGMASRQAPSSTTNVSSTSRGNADSSSTSTVEVKCRCGIQACERTTVKEGPNKGRRFWSCTNTGSAKCDFFEWLDGPSTGGAVGRSTRVREKRPAPEKTYSEPGPPGAHSPSSGVRRCRCDMTAVQKTVVKEGPNQGRKFWSCPNSEKARCGFFEWDDGEPGGGNGQGNSNSQSRGGGGSQTGECYKCGQSGHWASSCKNGETSDQKKTNGLSSGSTQNNNASSSLACFKCGMEGHFSNACPNGGNKTQGGTPASGACFKCGEEGHYSSACPGSGAPSKRKPGSGSGTKRGRGKSSTRARGTGKRARTKAGFAAADGY